MHSFRHTSAVLVVLTASAGARAGLYYSGEKIAALPSQWRGFLLDQRILRNIALKPDERTSASPARLHYQEEATRLEKKAKRQKLTADEQADLGAIYVRLGEVDRAVERLRAAQRAHPKHFQIVANLGTACQLQGDLSQATACLYQAVRLAPGKLQKAEEYQLKLVRLRQRQGRDKQTLDDLFGVRYVGEKGKYQPGTLAKAQRKKLPSNAAAIVQQLALWLPADGRLLWQLAELAGAHGDVKNATAMLDGCVTQFGIKDPELRRHRLQTRAAVEELARKADSSSGAKVNHKLHIGTLPARSKRPLLSRLDAEKLPDIDPKGINSLPWAVLAETTLDRKYKPTFADYLKDLAGKRIELSGFMQPLGDDGDTSSFMLIEYPVGCWYCEMPETTGIVLVELAQGQAARFTRGLVKVVGKLTLNATDPENFLYIVGATKVAEAD
jgi:Flp pilus assembly protein TadD